MEQYPKKPTKVEIFPLGSVTDVILRKSIAKAEIDDGNGGTTTCWQCEERQLRVPAVLTAKEVSADFDTWWDYTPAEDEPTVTETDRLDALEAAVCELAEVIAGG